MRKQRKSYSISNRTLNLIEEAYRKEYKEYFNTTPSPVKPRKKPCSDSAFLETLLLEALKLRGFVRS